MTESPILEQARETLRIEMQAIGDLVDSLGADFEHAVDMLLHMQGRAIVCGMGKSGAIGRKIAGTLASTGTPAYYLHPAEAVHGDLGMVTGDDVVIMLSNSGETEEIVHILPSIKRIGAKIISICGKMQSTLTRDSEVVLSACVSREACPLNLAPTASTIAALAMGDALAMALMTARGFTTDDFAIYHPSGSLGKRILLRVRDIMHSGQDNPTIGLDATVLDALLVMTSATVRGAVSVVDNSGRLRGFFTDGDFRLLMQREPDRNAVMARPVLQVMTLRPTVTSPDMLAAEAARIMQDRKFDNLPVVDADGLALGTVDIQDLMTEGVV
jgi:arabinose-5-phosphate isomerase